MLLGGRKPWLWEETQVEEDVSSNASATYQMDQFSHLFAVKIVSMFEETQNEQKWVGNGPFRLMVNCHPCHWKSIFKRICIWYKNKWILYSLKVEHRREIFDICILSLLLPLGLPLRMKTIFKRDWTELPIVSLIEEEQDIDDFSTNFYTISWSFVQKKCSFDCWLRVWKLLIKKSYKSYLLQLATMTIQSFPLCRLQNTSWKWANNYSFFIETSNWPKIGW